MGMQLLSAPALEPVSLAEAKAQLRVDGTAEDALIDSLIVTSRLHIEAALGLALISQSWRLVLDCWPLSGGVELPVFSVTAVTAVRTLDADGDAALIDSVGYAVDAIGRPARVTSRSGYWPAPGAPTNGIEIDFDAGYGAAAADVPAPIRQALLMLVAHWYEHRDPAAAETRDVRVPGPISDLLAPYRLVSL